MAEKIQANARKVVSDASKLPKSNDPQAILKQVEFYFSDENLPRDKFLWQATQKNDGWVSIKTIHSFSRMRRFEPFEAVVEALRTSPELLEVSEDGENVRRKNALLEPKADDKKNAFDRTIYAKGFGPETETSQFDIEAFFEKYGSTKQVRLRRADDGSFKSSVFVEFTNIEDAQAFLAAEPKPKYGEETLLTLSKQAYVDMKKEEHGFTAKANGQRRKFNAFRQTGPPPNKRRRQSDAKSGDDFKRSRKERDVPETAVEEAVEEAVEAPVAETAVEAAVEAPATEAAAPVAETTESTKTEEASTEAEPIVEGNAEVISETGPEGDAGASA